MSKTVFNCPDGHDFSNKGVDYNKLKDEYILRTDAVWEKQQLRDYFRLYMKAFWFNTGIQGYLFVEPEDLQTIHHEGWGLEDFEIHQGFNPTGRSSCFQATLPPKQQIQTSVAAHAVSEDYYELCALRFEQYHKCDIIYYDERDKYDYRIDDHSTYPCFREFYEAQYSCSDDLFEFLMEMSNVKKAAGLFTEDVANWELNSMPTVYDTPKGAERKTYTY